jgi:hypothetical protein
MKLFRTMKNTITNFMCLHPTTIKLMIIGGAFVTSIAIMATDSNHTAEAARRVFVCSAGPGGPCWLE